MLTNSEEGIKVSVLCLAYNHGKYIRDTLEGFVNQKTDFQYEVLIHDDASTDHTASIIAEYAEQYPNLIKPIYQTENQHSKGVKIHSTYNYPRAKGKYFAWCEGDDYWCDEYKLQKQFDIMEKNSDCSICVHKVQCINEDGTKNARVIPEKSYNLRSGKISDSDIANALWVRGSYPFHTSCYFVRRNAMTEIMDESFPCIGYMNGDQNVLRSALKNGSFWFIDEVMSCRRLESIGNYNSRISQISEQEKMNLRFNSKKGDLLFDDYTSGRFHFWIMQSISNTAIAYATNSPEYLNDFLSFLHLTKADVLSSCSIKRKLLYYFSIYMHPLYSFLRHNKHGI